jgi:dephospho-CoA kinase
MVTVGITGGMGSGKSLICEVLQTLGIPVFFADDEVKKIYNEDADLRQSLINRYGERVYKDNVLQTKALAQIVFNNSEALAQLNALVYPALQQRFEQWQTQQQAAYAAMEAALLCESGMYAQMNVVVNVVAPENVRIARVLQRNKGMTEQEVRRRMSYQWNDEQRSKFARFTIVNDGEMALLPQILTLHKQFIIDN